MGKSSKTPVTVYDHIRELRNRLLASVGSLIGASLAIYLFYAKILAFLCLPLHAPLYYSNPAGSFSFVMKICFSGALIVTVPIIIYNIAMFARPAFADFISKKQIVKVTLLSTFLAFSGAAFAFFCILPGTLSFFKGFQVNGLSALISADSYLNFVTNIIIMFVVVFQIPLIILFIDKIKPIKPSKLFKMEKWVVIGSLVLALIAPFTYDLLTSLLIALPVIGLYNLSILMVVMRHAKARQIAHKNFCANIAKPNTNRQPLYSDSTFDNLANELILSSQSEQKNIVSQMPTADIMPVSKQSRQEVQPAAWVIERKRRRMELNKQVHVFSDIKPKSKTNPVLASQ